jgi:hypothetical protein
MSKRAQSTRRRKIHGGAYERSKEGIVQYFKEKMPRAHLLFQDINDSDRYLTAGVTSVTGPMGPIEQYTYRLTVTHPGMGVLFGYVNPETGKNYWWKKDNRAAAIEFGKWVDASYPILE